MMLNQDLDCSPDGGECFQQTAPPYSLGILPSLVGLKDGEPNMKLLGSLSSLEMQPAAGHHHFPSQAQVRNYSVCSACLLKNHSIYSSSDTLLASLQSFAFRILLTTLPFVSTKHSLLGCLPFTTVTLSGFETPSWPKPSNICQQVAISRSLLF
jgi:hypothetical protein